MNDESTQNNNNYRDKMYFGYLNEGLYSTIDSITIEKNNKKKKMLLANAIQKYPHYYDFYTELSFLCNSSLHDSIFNVDEFESAIAVAELGCRFAIQRLKDENGGKLPKKMEYKFADNRHIFRIIYRYAECLSEYKDYKKSNRQLRLLNKLDPSGEFNTNQLKKKNRFPRV